jgi:hypothetical protein
VAVAIRHGIVPLGERQELVAHVEEGHARHPAAQVELEDARVELERLLDIAHRDGDVVDPYHPSHLLSLCAVGNLKA